VPSSRQLAILAVLCAGCGAQAIDDPKDAAAAYAEAASRGDADALYEMLGEKGKRSLTRAEVRALVAAERAELGERAKALRAPGVLVTARATVRYPDGEEATLDLEKDGVFRISAVDALPSGARTPAQALEELRRVLARRSYAGLMRVLTPSTRAAIEADLRSLVEGLERPEGLEVDVAGDTATVPVPGGHEVKLRREAGVWRVEDFD
jgi:hypothetical protein